MSYNKTPTDLFSPRDTIIKLSVGPTQEVFNVHQGLLTKSSEFFKRAMKPEWAASRSDPHTIDLSEDSPETVTLYINWLYHPNIETGLPTEKYNDTTTSRIPAKGYGVLAKAYVFGEKVMDTKFKTAVLLKLIEVEDALEECPGANDAIIVYAGTPAGSPMRQLITDLAVYNADDGGSWADYFKDIPSEAVIDVVTTMAKVRTGPSTKPYKTSPGVYTEKEEP
jgi:hypothetical protein